MHRLIDTARGSLARSRALAPLVLGSALAIVLVACAGQPRRDAAAPNADQLYANMESALTRYREGLHALRAGDHDSGRQLMGGAVADLQTGADKCLVTRGCEPQRFMAAYGNLLALRSSVLTNEAVGFVEMQPTLAGEDATLEDEVPEVQRTVNLLHGNELAKIIKINGPVKAALHDWLTWMRPNLVDAYENYEYMRYLMFPAYEKAGLPEALLFGILAKESGGKVHAVSQSGAAGPLQFMYQTGVRFGLTTVDGFDMRYDPAAAARANVAYLSEQFRYLNNNLEMALAAYNGGEGRMRRLAQGSRSKNFWSSDIFSKLPRETQEYVPYVLAAAWLFLHPEDYGLEFPRVDSTPGEVQLVNAMTLGELTVCLGQAGSRDGWFRTLRNLNPRVDPSRRLPAGSTVAMPARLVGVYQEQCVDGRMAELAVLLQDARQSGGGSVAHAGGRQYVVKRGDTLASIARKQGCASTEALARANNIAAPRYTIKPAQELKLLGCNG
jgi:membrane-bound lytic murein transglycosylase D